MPYFVTYAFRLAGADYFDFRRYAYFADDIVILR